MSIVADKEMLVETKNLSFAICNSHYGIDDIDIGFSTKEGFIKISHAFANIERRDKFFNRIVRAARKHK